MPCKVIKSFQPSLPVTLAVLLFTGLFIRLGFWQISRAAEKAVVEHQFSSAGVSTLDEALTNDRRFAHITTSGRYDTQRHILLDNQVWQGRAGVHVFTPFYTDDGKVILVNRGWLPLVIDRKTLPDVPTPQGETELKGILNLFPVPGRMLGKADRLKSDQWPQLVTYMNHDDISAALGAKLEDRIVQLADTAPNGFSGRDWKPVYLTSSRHRGYALQWFALAFLSLVLWVVSGFRHASGGRV